MNTNNKIDSFMSKLKHPLKSEMEAVINIIRNTSSKIEEDVKWGGPSFDFKEPMATINPRVQEYVAIIFHKGELIKDKTGLLEAGPKGRAYVKLDSLASVKAHKSTLQQIVKEWIKIMG